MPRALNEFDGLEKSDIKVLTDIEEFGCHVLGVFSNEKSLYWAFTIGLYYTFNHPEIILFSHSLQSSNSLTHSIASLIKSGHQFREGQPASDILESPYQCEFRIVSKSNYSDHLGYALWFYENYDFPVIQCFWPDKRNKLPWDTECEESIRRIQPLLYRAKA